MTPTSGTGGENTKRFRRRTRPRGLGVAARRWCRGAGHSCHSTTTSATCRFSSRSKVDAPHPGSAIGGRGSRSSSRSGTDRHHGRAGVKGTRRNRRAGNGVFGGGLPGLPRRRVIVDSKEPGDHGVEAAVLEGDRLGLVTVARGPATTRGRPFHAAGLGSPGGRARKPPRARAGRSGQTSRRRRGSAPATRGGAGGSAGRRRRVRRDPRMPEPRRRRRRRRARHGRARPTSSRIHTRPKRRHKTRRAAARRPSTSWRRLRPAFPTGRGEDRPGRR